MSAPYTVLMKFAACVRNDGHTFVGEPGAEKCSVCGADRDGKSLLQLIAEAKAHTPNASETWQCARCPYMNAGPVCTKCFALKPTDGAGCG